MVPVAANSERIRILTQLPDPGKWRGSGPMSQNLKVTKLKIAPQKVYH